MVQKPVFFEQVKSCILSFHNATDESVTDRTPFLQNLCEALESVLRMGLKCGRRLMKRKDYWDWMKSIPNICEKWKLFVHPSYLESVNSVLKCRSVTTTQGRGRLLIRMLLHSGTLDFPFKLLLTNMHLSTAFYEESESVMGNDILIQIFYSLVSEVCRIPFDLNVENTEFLDETWCLPIFKTFMFVPCKMLGARVETVDGHYLVTEVDPTGVVAEDNQIAVGDILSTMYGCMLHNSGVFLNNLRSIHDGQPVPIGVTKALMSDGHIYPHLRSLLEQHGYINLIAELERTGHVHIVDSSDFFQQKPWCHFRYIGHCEVGSTGGVNMINRSIVSVLSNLTNSAEQTPVHIELGELGVTIWQLQWKDNKVDRGEDPLLRHSYPQISSCGRRTDGTNYFAYIAGEESCTTANHFTCYVFESVNKEEAKRIISGLSLGFDRTHWTL
ncbi:RUN and FYVE domain-containing protein isoform 2 [Schistosoma japonicum]|uniref:RUN and FYVE domain-containing protein isoform 2 n=1 Tax=Schistosoma japonicum TaxID=6182 RepID=A0A4Z2DL34_SCHJA|nr:RUN and FYVE domain-containing protein 4 [Schistosoma japonicum]KAH8875708.1 RUN and FYVE domain-containing protein 4 [Schistosoma japonicum]KAH8875710.1 RUN and FYVE domain-containing protein 4 [Schistosoma japonicum]TNN17253.1 RUN and FYVE domain-containing protein isoform 2 [Schistosoma japonicum]TNN17254.1 RUN and FYVE domain-containing protein isoform 2 [Schistosoma japonicum]